MKFRCTAGVSVTSLPIATFDEKEWKHIITENPSAVKCIPCLDAEDTTYEKFFNDYLLKNIPCMISQSVTESWSSRQLWCEGGGESCSETINYGYLVDVYGEMPVSAVNCNDAEYKEGYGTRDCRDMTFREYIEYFKITSAPSGERTTEKRENPTSPSLYLKDWHIVRAHKTLTADGKEGIMLPYECPIYFHSDWLNEFCEDKDLDDFKFCYMGPKGTFTSFHADVYGSYSWSANVFGVKRWYLYPPGKERRFFDDRLKKLSFRWDDPGNCGEDYVEVIQNPGECIFVPSGWHHVVWNLTDAVSINHNWFNGSNLCYIWSVLRNALREVEKELDDLRDIPEFHEQCQLVLKANHGMNYEGFFEILKHIKGKRSKYLSPDNEKKESEFPNEKAFPWVARFDTDAILHVIEEHCMEDLVVQTHFSELMLALTGRP